MPSLWLKEVWFLVLGAVCTATAGWLLGNTLAALLLVSVCYITWLLLRIQKIIRWLNSGGAKHSAPASLGMLDDIVRLVHREKLYSRKQKNRFKRSLLQFNNLASELPDATVVLDDNNVIRWANAAASTLMNVRTDHDRGQRINNLIREPEFLAFLNSSDATSEIEMVAPANPSLMLACRRIPSGSGMSVLVARDVTQRLRLREMRKDFVEDVSHELRTPLTVIRGYTEMLLDSNSLNSESKHSIEKIDEQSDRMMQIVQKLLSLSRLEGNPLNDDEGDVVNVSELIRTIVDDLSNTANSKHEWVLELDESLALRGNYDELYSVVENLLQNSVKYSGHGTVISVRWTQEDVLDRTADISAGATTTKEEFAGASITVRDDGIGIEADSKPGEGSEFTVHFPAQRVESSVNQASNF